MIQVFITGGTLDKDYDEISGTLTFPGTCVPDMFTQGRVDVPLRYEMLMQKDSLELTDQDRALICKACAQTEATQILITHGTDTMVESAQALAAVPALKHKTIILTGAMRPHRLGRSDALFNLGSALMAVQLAQSGVWIAMQGRLFPHHQVQKNRQLGRFEAH